MGRLLEQATRSTAGNCNRRWDSLPWSLWGGWQVQMQRGIRAKPAFNRGWRRKQLWLAHVSGKNRQRRGVLWQLSRDMRPWHGEMRVQSVPDAETAFFTAHSLPGTYVCKFGVPEQLLWPRHMRHEYRNVQMRCRLERQGVPRGCALCRPNRKK